MQAIWQAIQKLLLPVRAVEKEIDRNVRVGQHDEHVARRLGRDVPKGIDQLVLIDLGGGDDTRGDFAEQTVFHNTLSLMVL